MPKTSYYKLIDWWLLILFNLLALTLGFQTYLSYIVSKATKESFFKGETKVQSFNESNKEQEEERKKENLMNHARSMNTIAKITFITLLVMFNIVFWTIAFLEHFRPAENYI